MTADDDGVDPLAAACLQVLEARGQTLGAAESVTAGLIVSTLASVPGASNVVRGGLTAYTSDVKVDVLGVDARVLAEHGVYSARCAEAMAAATCRLLACDWAVATTGVAGPGADDGHPPGEVHVAVAAPDGTVASRSMALTGGRQAIRAAAAQAGLGLLLDRLT